jgi:hypothetical protein
MTPLTPTLVDQYIDNGQSAAGPIPGKLSDPITVSSTTNDAMVVLVPIIIIVVVAALVMRSRKKKA